MDEERYIVVSVTGGEIPSGEWGTVYSILDTACCHREVATFAPGMSGDPGVQWRRAAAKQEAKRLNELDREDMNIA